MAGFAVGIVDKEKVINGKNIKAGDVLIGLESSGVHSNGFSLIRKLFGETKSEIDVYDERLQKTYGEALLEPTRIYVKSILGLMQKVEVKGIAHITGGGFIENIPRVFPDGIGCEIDLNSYKLSPLYEIIKEKSGLKNEQLYNTFNMGIGMVVVVDKKDADLTIATLNELGEKAHLIGKTINGKGVTLK